MTMKSNMTADDRAWIENHFDTLRREVVKIQIDLAGLKVKSGLVGLLGGCIPVIVLLCVYWITRK